MSAAQAMTNLLVSGTAWASCFALGAAWERHKTHRAAVMGAHRVGHEPEDR